MGLKLGSSSGGSVELVAATTASTFTATVPAATGTMLLKESTSGMSVPAVSAYGSTNQSLTSSAWNKVTFDTKEFDTNNMFASSRLTPTVAGYYQVTTGVSCSAVAILSIYKNGTEYKRGFQSNSAQTGNTASALVYCNGSTDYVEVYIYPGSSVSTTGGAALTYMQAVLTRAA